MAQETKQTQAPILCTMGCGFYGNLRNDGMCSVCYKEFLQRQNSNRRISAPEVAVGGVDEILSMQLAEGSSSHVAPTLATTEPLLEQSSVVSNQTPSQASSTQSEDGGQTGDSDTQGLKAMTAGDLEPTSSEGRHGSEDTLKPRKSRCFMCRKKVGLTGFDCRCGNVFCGLHRYSDAHSCTFDYKADAAEKIRKENPVVIGEKIQKI